MSIVNGSLGISDGSLSFVRGQGEEDLGAAVQDAEFLQQVLGSLPGVDPQSEAVRSAVGSVARKEEQKDGNKKDDDQKS